jgi:ElaB/YqjD/DUF883 family membrane-anchored ribosome-binding protein
MGQSKIARLREQIEREYQASQRVFTDFTPTAQHEYITKRQENIERCIEDLTKEVGIAAAVGILIQVEQGLYGGVSSSGNTS